MEDIYTQRNGKADEPHRHDYYTVLLVAQGNGTHSIDFNAYPLANHQIYFVSPGQVHQVIEEEKSIGFAMTFSTAFLVENSIHLSFVESLNLFHDYGQSPPLALNAQQLEKLNGYCTEIHHLHHSDAAMKELAVGSYLKLLLIACNTICSINPLEASVDLTGNQTIRAFKEHVNAGYKEQHGTSYYADLMHITPDHLNRSIKNAIGITAKEYIQSRITTEAKRLLYFTELTTKEIAFDLGFSEPSHFSAFFKKCTKTSPTEFRQHH
jgi:AraC-like DNA-binding protein